MSVQLSCPHCQRSLLIKKPQPGSTIRCPVCTGPLQVPGPAAAQPATWWLDQSAAAPAPPDEKPGHAGALCNPRALAAVGAGALMLGGVVMAALGMFRPAAAVALPNVFAPPVVTEPLVLVAERPAQVDVAADEPLQAALAPAVDRLQLGDPLLVGAAPGDVLAVEGLKDAGPPAPVPAAPPIIVKRLSTRTDEDLRKQLLKAPELNLDPPNEARRSGRVYQVSLQGPTQGHLTPKLLMQYADTAGLAYRMGADCQLGKEHAENMQVMSRKLRGIMAESMNRNGAVGNRIDADFMKEKMSGAEFQRTSAVACYLQMLQPENQDVRKLMVSQLAGMKHRSASEALARLAVFDLADEVRDEAIKALNERPRAEYRQVLLAGLRHVWPAAADHAAETLVAVQDRAAVPQLRTLAQEPNPAAPYFDQAAKGWMTPEMVRINHLSNCLLCHAASRSTTDMVRGRIPSANQPLPPMTQYYEDNTGIFVRADVTYLKQDFSVYQPVENPGKWPLMQRYDYVVRNRRIDTQAELASRLKNFDTDYPQRQAVLFALGELSR